MPKARQFVNPLLQPSGPALEEDTPVSQHASKPVSQQDSMPVSQYTSIPVSQYASMPALVKATFYLTEDDIMLLEHIRLARRGKGIRLDKSALVREAIKLLQP